MNVEVVRWVFYRVRFCLLIFESRIISTFYLCALHSQISFVHILFDAKMKWNRIWDRNLHIYFVRLIFLLSLCNVNLDIWNKMANRRSTQRINYPIFFSYFFLFFSVIHCGLNASISDKKKTVKRMRIEWMLFVYVHFGHESKIPKMVKK